MKGSDEDCPSVPKIAPEIQKADAIIDEVGLQEVREVYESELGGTQKF